MAGMVDKPIPAFYACYLLRSTVRHQALYVGSTPHPARRCRQHNGEAKGGAVRTSRDTLRPWEMTCLVTGFPSKIAALQFEWAWQNTHLTRHVSPSSRLSRTINTLSKAGRARKRPPKPRLGLTDYLANLHLLLRVSSFERWPLKVTFYAEDVFKVWLKWTRQHLEHLRPGIEVSMCESMKAESAGAEGELRGIRALDVGYVGLKPVLERNRNLFAAAEWLDCVVCRKGVPPSGAMTLVCPEETCSALSHVSCLSSAFLRAEGKEAAIVPTLGACPKCKTKLQWVDLVKELSLRMRGTKEMEALFKVRRSRKKQATAGAQELESEPSADEDDEDEPLPGGDDGWLVLDQSSEDEARSSRILSDLGPVRKLAAPIEADQIVSHSEPVIEDSDWDEAEVLT